MSRAHRTTLACLLLILACRAAPAAADPPAHLIGVRVGTDGVGEFYNVGSGQSFTPQGNNLIRVASLPTVFNPMVSNPQHSLLVPGQYNGPQVDAILGTMAADGYNIVRIFLAPGCTACLGNIAAPGLNPAYVADLVDFLQRAKSHNLEVIITTDDPPDAGGYLTPLNNEDPSKFGGNNLRYLSVGGVQSDQAFWHDLVQGLIAANAPTDIVFSYELRNEFSFDANQPPLSLAAGSITTANGQSYDMSNAVARQQMLQDGMVYWFNAETSVIKQLDPTALVSSGFFEPQGPNPSRINDTRLIQIYPAAAVSALDYVSLHPYPGIDLTLPQYVENFGSAAYPKKPILMEEFGAFREFFPTVQQAADALRQWQVASCDLNFRGWLLWTFDEPITQQAPQPVWNALDGKSEVNQALSPLSRPACLPHNTVTSLSLGQLDLRRRNPSLVASVVASGNGGVVTGSMTYTDIFIPPGTVGGPAAVTTVLGTIPLQHLRNLAVLHQPPLTAGLHFLTAAYSGDGNDSGSVSLPVAEVSGNPRAAAVTTTRLVLLSAQPLTQEAEARTPFLFRVSVSGKPPRGRGASGGTVSLWDGMTEIASAPLKSGAVSIPVQNLAGGAAHRIVAVYSGQVRLNGSVSGPLDIYVFR